MDFFDKLIGAGLAWAALLALLATVLESKRMLCIAIAIGAASILLWVFV